MKHILTITGASGAGKDTLVDALKQNKNLNIRELISHTTRAPRTSEQNGIDYYFIDMKTFNTLTKVEEIEYAGNHYCLAADELDNIPDNGWGVVIVDQNGLKDIENFVNKFPDKYTRTSVFLTISETTSEQRMKNRGDKPDIISRRLTQQAERHEYTPTHPDKYQFIFKSENKSDFESNISTLNKLLTNS